MFKNYVISHHLTCKWKIEISSKAVLNQVSADSRFMTEISKQITQSGHLPHPLSERQTQIVRGKGTLPRDAECSEPISCQSPQGKSQGKEVSDDGWVRMQSPL